MKNKNLGFSLIEILVSITVLGILASSVTYFITTQNKFSVFGSDSVKALNLGKLKMDSLKVSSYDSLKSGVDTVADRYIRTWAITTLTNGGVATGLKQIDLSVSFPLTAEHFSSLVSMVSNDKFKEDP